LILTTLFLGAWLARRNLRAGRGDTKRALRVALVLMAARIAAWALGGHVTAVSFTEQLASAIAWGLYDFAFGGLSYLAIEPYVRRLWPRVLTSWMRMLDGQHADPRVGRDLLIGCLVGVGIALLVAGHQAAPALFGAPPGRPDNVGYIEHQLTSLLGLRFELAEILALLRSNFVLILEFIVILVVARLTLRHSGAAIALAFAIFVPLALPRGEFIGLNVALAVGSTLLLLIALLRFGLLTAMVGLMTYTALQAAPLGHGIGTWSTNRTVLVLALVLAVGLYGFRRALAGRPVFRDLLAEG